MRNRGSFRRRFSRGYFRGRRGQQPPLVPPVGEVPPGSASSFSGTTIPNDPETRRITLDIKTLLPNVDEYFGDRHPVLEDFKKKVHAAESVLRRASFITQAASAEGKSTEGYGVSPESFYEIVTTDLIADTQFNNEWETFVDELTNQPEDVIGLFGAVCHKLILERLPVVPHLRIGFKRDATTTNLALIRASHLSKYITVQGIVTKTTDPTLFCHRLGFRCLRCTIRFGTLQVDGNYTLPRCCPGQDCTANKDTDFEVEQDSIYTRLGVCKRLRLQEDLDNGSTSMVPKSLEVDVHGELTEFLSIGDTVLVSGILRNQKDAKSKSRLETLHTGILDAFTITMLRENVRTLGGNLLNVTDDDYAEIRRIHGSDRLLRLLVNSMSPGIVGNELIKFGLLLALLGGSRRETSADGLRTRSDINLMMIGDASQGKSKLLQFAAEVAPKAVMICGSGASAAGLSVSLVKENDTYVIDPGAIVIAHQATLLIDEADKLTSGLNVLLEAMEQQTVSVAKATVTKTFPARTSIIMAANPIGGKYNRSRSLIENVRFSLPLLTRCDLIFCMLSASNEAQDRQMTERLFDFETITNGLPLTATLTTPPNRLVERLRWKNVQNRELVDPVMLRKYIAYARQYSAPRLNAQAKQLLQRYYVNLRLRSEVDKAPAITIRALESLIRLTEASAKLELAEEANLEHAANAIELYDFCREHQQNNDAGSQPPAPSSALPRGFVRPARTTARTLLSALQQIAVQQQKWSFSTDELKTITKELGAENKHDYFVGVLNNAGLLIIRHPNVYELIN